jgi:hypothetical protein
LKKRDLKTKRGENPVLKPINTDFFAIPMLISYLRSLKINAQN